jgi:hypothetical protein
MRELERGDAVLGIAVATIVVLLILWSLEWPRSGRSTGASALDTGSGSVRAPTSFTITGDIARAIAPGDMLPLDLSLANPNDVDLSIDQITVRVHSVDAPRADAEHPCSAADFEVRQLRGDVVLRLEANRAQTLSEMEVPPGRRPALGMLDRPVNQDGCKAATLSLTYSASGTTDN